MQPRAGNSLNQFPTVFLVLFEHHLFRTETSGKVGNRQSDLVFSVSQVASEVARVHKNDGDLSKSV